MDESRHMSDASSVSPPGLTDLGTPGNMASGLVPIWPLLFPVRNIPYGPFLIPSNVTVARDTRDEQGGISFVTPFVLRYDMSGSLETADDNTTLGSVENEWNEERKKQLRQFTGRLIQLTRESSFEYGFENELDQFLREQLAQNAAVTREWLNEVFIENLDDVAVTVGLLRAIAHLSYDEVRPQGPTMAIAALSHKDVQVRECGIRAFENWESLESLKVLETIECQDTWLQDYAARVVADLRKGLDHVAPGAED